MLTEYLCPHTRAPGLCARPLTPSSPNSRRRPLSSSLFLQGKRGLLTEPGAVVRVNVFANPTSIEKGLVKGKFVSFWGQIPATLHVIGISPVTTAAQTKAMHLFKKKQAFLSHVFLEYIEH